MAWILNPYKKPESAFLSRFRLFIDDMGRIVYGKKV